MEWMRGLFFFLVLAGAQDAFRVVGGTRKVKQNIHQVRRDE